MLTSPPRRVIKIAAAGLAGLAGLVLAVLWVSSYTGAAWLFSSLLTIVWLLAVAQVAVGGYLVVSDVLRRKPDRRGGMRSVSYFYTSFDDYESEERIVQEGLLAGLNLVLLGLAVWGHYSLLGYVTSGQDSERVRTHDRYVSAMDSLESEAFAAYSLGKGDSLRAVADEHALRQLRQLRDNCDSITSDPFSQCDGSDCEKAFSCIHFQCNNSNHEALDLMAYDRDLPDMALFAVMYAAMCFCIVIVMALISPVGRDFLE